MADVDELIYGTLIDRAKVTGPDTWRYKVLMAIADSGRTGATDNELSDLLQAPGGQNNIRPRRGELVDRGYVVDSQEKRRTPSGSQATVWRLAVGVQTNLTPSFTEQDCQLASQIADDGQHLEQMDRAAAEHLRARFALLGRRVRRAAAELGVPVEVAVQREGAIEFDTWPVEDERARFHIESRLDVEGLHLVVNIGSAETGDQGADSRAQRFRVEMENLTEEALNPVELLLKQGWSATTATPGGSPATFGSIREWLHSLAASPESTGNLSVCVDSESLAQSGPDSPIFVNDLLSTILPVVKAAEDAMHDPVQALMNGLFWDEDRARHLLALAGRARQLLFAGPPGTGKTLAARILAGALGDESRIKLVQFHPTYAYEDFVEGIRPIMITDAAKTRSEDADSTPPNSQIQYSIRPGVFKQLVSDACSAPPEAPHFLIIDEINRANLPRVLGELLFALEYRGPDNEVELAYSAERFYVPDNLWVIGTMNTADRSVAVLDAAMRRRFKEVRFDVDYTVIRRWHERHTSPDLGTEAADRLKRLNAEVVELLDDDRAIGHSFLIRRDLADVGFETIWHEDLEPVLRDHLLGRTEDLPSLRRAFLESL